MLGFGRAPRDEYLAGSLVTQARRHYHHEHALVNSEDAGQHFQHRMHRPSFHIRQAREMATETAMFAVRLSVTRLYGFGAAFQRDPWLSRVPIPPLPASLASLQSCMSNVPIAIALCRLFGKASGRSAMMALTCYDKDGKAGCAASTSKM